CGNVFAFIYFVSFQILAPFVMMNLFIAVILDNFSAQMHFEDSALNHEHLRDFAYKWTAYDPHATHVIPTGRLKSLLKDIGEPLALKKNCDRGEFIRLLVSLDIPEHQGQVHFVETLIPLARRVYDIKLPPEEAKKQEARLKSAF